LYLCESYQTALATGQIDNTLSQNNSLCDDYCWLVPNLRTKLNDNRDDINYIVLQFPHLDSNMPTAPAYGCYISQLIHYARACSLYSNFLCHRILSTKQLSQW